MSALLGCVKKSGEFCARKITNPGKTRDAEHNIARRAVGNDLRWNRRMSLTSIFGDDKSGSTHEHNLTNGPFPLFDRTPRVAKGAPDCCGSGGGGPGGVGDQAGLGKG